TSLNSLAGILKEEGKLDEAESLFRETLSLRRKILTPGNPLLVQSVNNLARLLYPKRNVPEAESLLREALEMQRKFPAKQFAPGDSAFRLVQILLPKGQTNEAVELLREAAEAGNSAAQYEVASLYENGTRGLPKNLPEAAKFYEKSAS